jgi:hypothetical protein
VFGAVEVAALLAEKAIALKLKALAVEVVLELVIIFKPLVFQHLYKLL